MKMVIAVVQDKDSNRLSDALVKDNIRATAGQHWGVLEIRQHHFFDRNRR